MHQFIRLPRAKLASAVLAVCLLALASGCVQRRMTIRSNPPGALVFIDGYEIGTTPVSTDFIYYGTRELRLVKDGYQTLRVLQPVPAPWYQYFPIDFFAENVVPYEIRDQRTLDFALAPQTLVPTDALISRANVLRHGGVQPGFMPPGAGPAIRPLPPAAPGPGNPEIRLPR